MFATHQVARRSNEAPSANDGHEGSGNSTAAVSAGSVRSRDGRPEVDGAALAGPFPVPLARSPGAGGWAALRPPPGPGTAGGCWGAGRPARPLAGS
jgi:hypothetical protein